MSNPFLDRIKIVLCRPEGGRNVGSICRTMENMGLSRLAIVGDISELNLKEVKGMAIHAGHIFDTAEFCTSLPEALNHTIMAAGITRRRGNRRKSFSYLPEELAEKASMTGEGTIALVFGNEQNGLNGSELAACTTACHIPSSPINPSLNLAQAVQVLAYVFYRQSEEKVGRFIPVELDAVDRLTGTIIDTLEGIGYFDKPDRFDTRAYFRDILSRATLSPREARHMEKVFRKIAYLKKRLPI
ncbi:RNA methyltransferase [Spirochaeta isovalerica]|uniref:tRNA/rRNA methyltransferase n=1 Tax=Spirochaeta isovalerica TaxID=150 RepID=A0A841R875_9SPIO|nr:RNA methyltransferase [Spirochaeta isovalerica]MBB6481484.1 tRNA/rRNA methyltransferase [Spirochaeta isovalerica]